MSTNDPVGEVLGEAGSGVATAMSDHIEESFREAKAEKVRCNTPVSYWCKWFPGLQHSPLQFYAAVEQKLGESRIPGLDLERILLRQGGVLSGKRYYLRSGRDKLVFEICAAPFGTGFFVSSRFFDRMRVARWYHVLLAVGILCALVSPFYSRFGLLWSAVIFSGVAALVLSFMRLAAFDALGWIRRILPKAPLIGRIYETYFNPDTFFRQDTNACYRMAVHELVMSAIDDMTNQHGIRRLTEEERRPTLGGR